MSIPISNNKYSNYFDLIYYEIWGPYRVESFWGAHYFLAIVDDAIRGTWVFLIREKSEAFHLLKNFWLIVRIQFGTCVKFIHSDNEIEFTSGPLAKFYGEQAIIHQTSCIDTPE